MRSPPTQPRNRPVEPVLMVPAMTLDEEILIGHVIGAEQGLFGRGDDVQDPADPGQEQVQPDGDIPAQHPVVGPEGGLSNRDEWPIMKRIPNTKYPSDVYQFY